MTGSTLINENPVVFDIVPDDKDSLRTFEDVLLSTGGSLDHPLLNDDIADEFTVDEIFDLLRSINDPEHPLTLEQLNVVQRDHIKIDSRSDLTFITVDFTPTIPHCSMATLIGLSIRVKLLRSLPRRLKVSVRVRKGTHQSEEAVNKQLADKERVAAALENQQLLMVVDQCLASSSERN